MLNDPGQTDDIAPGSIVPFLYDVRSWHASFDFLSALAVAEACRRVWYPLSGGLEVVILTGASRYSLSSVNFESTYTGATDHDRQRLHKILLPLAELVPAVKAVTVFDTSLGQKPSILGRDYIYPGGFDVDHLDLEPMESLIPKQRMMFLAGALTDIRIVQNSPVALADARAYATRLAGPERPVVFTLRNNKFSVDPDKDNAESFLAIAERVAERHPVIVVPDTADVPTGIKSRVPVAYEAAMCIRLRSALYEVARANFVGNSGPAILPQWNQNCAYYHSNIISASHPRERWENQWDAAYAILETGSLDPHGTARTRLQQNRQGPNFYAAECPYQVVDYEDLTVEKAEKFLALLSAMGR